MARAGGAAGEGRLGSGGLGRGLGDRGLGRRGGLAGHGGVSVIIDAALKAKLIAYVALAVLAVRRYVDSFSTGSSGSGMPARISSASISSDQ